MREEGPAAGIVPTRQEPDGLLGGGFPRRFSTPPRTSAGLPRWLRFWLHSLRSTPHYHFSLVTGIESCVAHRVRYHVGLRVGRCTRRGSGRPAVCTGNSRANVVARFTSRAHSREYELSRRTFLLRWVSRGRRKTQLMCPSAPLNIGRL